MVQWIQNLLGYWFDVDAGHKAEFENGWKEEKGQLRKSNGGPPSLIDTGDRIIEARVLKSLREESLDRLLLDCFPLDPGSISSFDLLSLLFCLSSLFSFSIHGFFCITHFPGLLLIDRDGMKAKSKSHFSSTFKSIYSVSGITSKTVEGYIRFSSHPRVSSTLHYYNI